MNEKSLTIQVREVVANDPDAAVHFAFEKAISALGLFVAENPGLRVAWPHEACVIKQHHHALRKDAFAEICHGKLHIKTPSTDGLFEVDASNGRPEIEFVETKRAIADYLCYRDFVYSVITGVFDWASVVDRLDAHEERLNALEREVETIKRSGEDFHA